MSIRELIAQSSLDRVETKLLLRHVLHLSAAELIMHNDRCLTSDELLQFNQAVQQRLSGVPINYITGVREFYSRDFRVTQDTLIPRPETELLVAELLALTAKKPHAKILDLGTGTGCIAITAKLECPTLCPVAVDKYEATLNVARDNAINLGAEVDFIQSDWYSNVKGPFNIIVSNPPYIECDDVHLDSLKYEPQHALTDFDNGLDCLCCIITAAPNYLEEAGYLIVEHGFDQGEAVRSLFAQNGFSSIKTVRDYANLERVTLGQY